MAQSAHGRGKGLEPLRTAQRAALLPERAHRLVVLSAGALQRFSHCQHPQHCSQEPRLTQPCSEPQAWLEGGEGGQAHLAASGGMGGGGPTLWPGGSLRAEKAAEPPTLWEGAGNALCSRPG